MQSGNNIYIYTYFKYVYLIVENILNIYLIVENILKSEKQNDQLTMET